MVNMSNLKFQIQAVGGKPQIYFGQERQPKDPRKFSYKTRDQRFPLREKVQPDDLQPPKGGGRPTGAARQTASKAPGPARKRSATTGAKKSSGADTVTLTQEQLELILSSVGKTAAADRDNSVRISVDSQKEDRTEGGLSIEAKASPRRRGVSGQRRGYRDSDDDSALGETADTGDSNDEEEKKVVHRSRPNPPTGVTYGGASRAKGGENILGLLAKAEGGGAQAGRQPRKRPPVGRESKPQREQPKPIQKRVEVKDHKNLAASKNRTGSKKEPMSEEDMDRKMQRIIAENKDKMSEAELVDLLASVYLEERQKNLLANPGEQEKGDDKRKVRKDDDRRRRKEEDAEEEDRRERRRYAERRRNRDDDSEDEHYKRNRGRGRRRRYDSDSDTVESQHSFEEEKRRLARTRDTRHRRRVSDSEDDGENYRTKSQKRSDNKDRTLQGRRGSENNEEDAKVPKEEKPQLEAPRYMTVAEKKRLQWEKEREELKNLKTYDPWGRPGAGAPPKETSSPSVLSKKEEDQQRYARELAEQVKEKRDLDQRDRRRYGGGGGGSDATTAPTDGGLANVDDAGLQLSGSFARGRGMANLDEKTRTEMEEQRRRHIEHQEAIKKQVEERQATRAQERERRVREEQEEETRLQLERDRLQKQYEDEQARTRRREVEHEARLAQLQAANEAAEQAALVDKARRRMERLRCGGHDTSGLLANFEAEMTARSQAGMGNSVPGLSRPAEVQMTTFTRAAAVPGLEGIAEVVDNQHMATNKSYEQLSSRWATPREPQVQASVRNVGYPLKEDLEVQTDPSLLHPLLQQAMEMAAASTAHAQEQPMRRKERGQHSQAPTQRAPQGRGGDKPLRYKRGFVVDSEKPPTGRSGHPVPVHERPKWGNANPSGRRALKQSEREIGDGKRHDRDMRRARREAELLAKVEANQNRIPRQKPMRRLSDTASPSPNWTVDEGPVYMGTYNLETGAGADYLTDGGASVLEDRPLRGVPPQRTGRASPPIPTQRRGGAHGGPMAISRSEENLVAAVRGAEAMGGFSDVRLVRTSEVLNPAKAERPLPVSREDTERQLARRTYLKGLNPAHYGDYMANLDDHRMEQGLPSKTTNAKNPIFNPGIVKDMPTPRQDAILQHLSDIRKNLLQKQKEIETSLSLGDNLA